MKAKTKKIWEETFSIYFVIIAILLFFIGFHNLDNCHNVIVFNLMENENYIECGLTACFEPTQCYAMGGGTLLVAFYMFLVVSILYLLNMNKKKE